MYTNFLRVARQLWVQLPGSGWCNADYDITMPELGKHVTMDYDYELFDRRKLDAMTNLTAADKDHIENVHTERSNRAALQRNEALVDT